MATAFRASGPKTRKAGVATTPAPAIFINSGASTNNDFDPQAQLLAARFGLSAPLASLVLGMLRERRQ
ncbi:MAG: hypothetical protein JOY99_12855 [Sphingomonadaceae bacterium]|nr:hypothetical protein [Sphingomonadaceae bacterium]